MIVVRAPFRLPVGGGGTDLPSYYKIYEGSLITAAINKYMYININEPAVSDVIKINYSKTEIIKPNELHLIQHDIVRETLMHIGVTNPMEITSMADLAAGTGMGSSSSYTVALLKALNTMYRRDESTYSLAEEACKVEIKLCGKPIGKQDQYAAAFGGLIHMSIDRSGYVTVENLNLNPETIHDLEDRFMMFYTDIQRDANVILGEQSNKIDIAGEAAKNQKSGEKPNESAALEAMHKIKQIGYEIKNCLLKGDVDGVGHLMHEHWMTKKKVSTKMSNSNIDTWYDLGMANGALGGKIMGAGGGGFLIFVAKSGQRRKLRLAMEAAGLKFMSFRFDFEGVKVLANV